MRFRAIVFDFDGTMCLLFKNFNLKRTVEDLHLAMVKRGIAYSIENDSFDVFETIMQQTEEGLYRTQALIEADKILTEAEIMAVDSCELVPGLTEVVRLLYNKGMSIGVSSNNSSKCIKKLTDQLWPDIPISITGRVGNKPHLMKPNSWSLSETLKKMDSSEESALFVGDTKRDYLCSESTQCSFIGMASTKKKKEKLLQFLSCNQIVYNFYDLQTKLMEIV